MQVKLINKCEDPIAVMWVAARTCYSKESPIDMFVNIYPNMQELMDNNTGKKYTQDQLWKLVKAVLNSGHTSIAEHVNFTFAIEGISRACSHQLVRHRLCTFSQQSQRYVEIKEDFSTLKQLYQQTLSKDKESRKQAIKTATEIVDKYFVIDNDKIGAIKYYLILTDYLKAIKDGCSPEDARMLLPNATKTNIVITTNLRNLMHMCDLRLCTRAQKEIRQLFKLIKEEVTKQNDKIGSLLMCQCDRLGYCPEADKCCGRKPTLQKILEEK